MVKKTPNFLSVSVKKRFLPLGGGHHKVTGMYVNIRFFYAFPYASTRSNEIHCIIISILPNLQNLFSNVEPDVSRLEVKVEVLSQNMAVDLYGQEEFTSKGIKELKFKGSVSKMA